MSYYNDNAQWMIPQMWPGQPMTKSEVRNLLQALRDKTMGIVGTATNQNNRKEQASRNQELNEIQEFEFL